MHQEIAISPTSAYSDLVNSISWNTTSGRNNILTIQSKCSRPYYKVRLSGPTLLGMDQMHHFSADYSRRIQHMKYSEKEVLNSASQGTRTEIVVHPVILSGAYNLEIIQLLCDVDMKKIDRHCLPASSNSLMLNKPLQLYLERDIQNSKHSHGYWKLTTNSTIPAVSTRFQLDKDCSGGNCDLSWYDNYEFVRQAKTHLNHIGNKTICFLGDSHSRRMAFAFREVFKRNKPIRKNNNSALHIRMIYPKDWSSQFAKLSARFRQASCTDIVIAIGQWPLSGKQRSTGHYNASQWIKEISTIVDYLHANTTASIILRSIHYVPLGYVRMSCPPMDWRMPYFVDMYNDKLRSLYNSHTAFREPQNKFIDSNQVLDPVWDTAADFNHNSDKAGIPEAIYMLKEMFPRYNPQPREHPIENRTPPQPASRSAAAVGQPPGDIHRFTSQGGLQYLLTQEFSLTILIWFVLVFFLPLLRRTRRLTSGR